MSKQKKWITYVCITAILCSTLIGCSSNKQTTVDKQASPTPKVLVSDEDKNSNLGQWGRAMGSVLTRSTKATYIISVDTNRRMAIRKRPLRSCKRAGIFQTANS